MIGTGSTVLGTAGVAALGLWSNDKHISTKFVVGSGIYALGLAMVGEANGEFASKLSLLVFVTALLIYGPSVAGKLGLIKNYNGTGVLGKTGAAIGNVIS